MKGKDKDFLKLKNTVRHPLVICKFAFIENKNA